jgi:hypothetical protein
MKKQTKQLVALVLLVVLWAVSWRFNRLPSAPVPVANKKAAREVALETPLTMRFHRIRAEMDGLYHYRLKPLPFVVESNPFRLPPSMIGIDDGRPPPPPPPSTSKQPVIEVAPLLPAGPAESGETLLRHAIQAARIGGVVTMNGTSQLNVNGELHKEGEVFTARLGARLILIRIKRLTTTFVIVALDDPESGSAEMRVRLD